MNQLTQQTMTIKELAEVAGCDTSTIQKVAKKLYPEIGGIKGRKMYFDQLQSEKILQNVGKKNFVERKISEVERKNSVLSTRLDRIESSLDRLTNIVGLLVNHQIEEKKVQVTLPPVNLRLELNAIIRSYASKEGILFPFAWEKFYDRIYQRLSMNARTQAKNENKSVLDWAEDNGYMELLYELAKAEFT